MPKVPMYTLAWSPAQATYVLSEPRSQEVLPIVPDSPAWFDWLHGSVSCFAFVGKSGRYTAHKEARQRGKNYWYAYLARGPQLSKKYLGKWSPFFQSAERPTRKISEKGGGALP